MKTKRLIALLGMMMIGLTACGKAKTPMATQPETNVSVQQQDSQIEDIVEMEVSDDETSKEESSEQIKREPVINRVPESEWDTTKKIIAICPMVGVSTGLLEYYDEIICECATIDGESMWLYMTHDDYKMNFNENSVVSTLGGTEIVFLKHPVQIQGTTKDAESYAQGLSETIESDKVVHLGNITVLEGTAVSEVEYSSGLQGGSCVYADIVTVEPVSTLGNISVSTVVCRCKTTDGSEVWIMMTPSDYKNYVDPDASFSIVTDFENGNFENPVRIHGVTADISVWGKEIQETTGTNIIIGLRTMDK